MAGLASLAQLDVLLAACAFSLAKAAWIQLEYRVSMSAYEYDPGGETTDRPEGSKRGLERPYPDESPWNLRIGTKPEYDQASDPYLARFHGVFGVDPTMY